MVAAASASHAMRFVPAPEFVWDVSGFAPPEPPKPLILWRRRDVNNINANEKFTNVPSFDDKFFLKWSSENGDLCLEAASLDNGAAVQVNTCNGGPLQEWKGSTLTGTKDGGIRSGGSNMCIAVKDDYPEDGKPLHMWNCNENGGQFWRLDRPDVPPAPAPPLPPPVTPSPGQCGACRSSANQCFTRYGFSQEACECQNNDGSCGNDWYMWVCKRQSGLKAWISSDCSKCNGDNNSPCPLPTPPTPPGPPPGPSGGTPCDTADQNQCFANAFGCQKNDPSTGTGCRCVNGPGTDSSKFKWYQWVCDTPKGVAFIDSKCEACFGLNGAPCPCSMSKPANLTIV